MTAAARSLMRDARTAALATVDPAGAPLSTLVAVTDDGRGRPLFFLSSLSEHTRNLRGRPDASVLIAPGGTSMDRPRLTLSGRIRWLEGGEAEAAKARFLSTHDEAQQWVALKDFAPALLELVAVRFVGGFARAQTMSVDDYLAAT
jgi:putative heme iron utilization protein